jgi:molecular chaperone GrpE (heat shock protein)
LGQTMDVDKHLVEIQRLKSFLLELDEELNEETIRSQKRIEELVQAVEERDAMIAELHRREEEEKEEEEEEEGDGFVDQLLTDNDKLRELLTIQEKTINELMEKNNNLQSALCMLQTSIISNVY